MAQAQGSSAQVSFSHETLNGMDRTTQDSFSSVKDNKSKCIHYNEIFVGRLARALGQAFFWTLFRHPGILKVLTF